MKSGLRDMDGPQIDLINLINDQLIDLHKYMTVFQVKRSMWESPCMSYPSARSPKLKWYIGPNLYSKNHIKSSVQHIFFSNIMQNKCKLFI